MCSPGETKDISDEWLLGLLARASSPHERRNGGWLQQTDTASGLARYHTWLAAVAHNNPDTGSDILHRRGLDTTAFIRSLADAQPIPGATLPHWAQTAYELMARLQATPVTDHSDATMPSPLYPGFAAWTHHAQRLVSAWSDNHQHPELLAVHAQHDLATALPRNMMAAIGTQLQREATSRERKQPLFHTDPAAEWREILTQHPVMMRILAVVWQQWQTTTKEIIERIATDLPELAPGQQVIALITGLGDQHGGGRSVAQISLDSGNQLFLKPRPAGPHRIVQAVLDAVDSHGDHLGLRLPVIATRAGYTWSTQINHVECAEEHDLPAYFYRTGALLRILQTIGATDLHHQNFVPTQNQPVPIDLETLLGSFPHLITRFEAPDTGEADLIAALADTPTATGMVTSTIDGPPGTASTDCGALTWLGPTRTALPGYRGVAVPMRHYVPELVAGYREAARRLATAPGLAAILKQCDDRRDDDRCDDDRHDDDRCDDRCDCDEPVRVVLRTTHLYTRLLAQSLSERALSDGAERDLVLERLWLAADTCPPALIEAEQESLRELDIPLFTVTLGSTDLISDHGTVIRSALACPPIEIAKRRLGRAYANTENTDDLLAALFAADPIASAAPEPAPEPASSTRHTTVAAVVDMLLGLAWPLPDGTVAWCGLDYDPSRRRWQHTRLGPGLLGEAGIGLVLAAVGSLRPEASPRCTPVGAATLLGAAARARKASPGWTSNNAFGGPSGTLYALARAAELTGDEQLLDAASELLPVVLAAAHQPSTAPVIDGVAGGVLACLHLPPSPARDETISELANLLESTNSPSDITHGLLDTVWSRCLPSVGAGRALAAYRLGWATVTPETDGSCELSTSQELPTSQELSTSRPGDAVAAAAMGLLGQTSWLTWPNPPRPMLTHDWLDRAETARATRGETTGNAHGETARATRDALGEAIAEIEAGFARTGSWFPDIVAPDTRNISAVHGIAAIAMLSLAVAGQGSDDRLPANVKAAPNVRVLA